MSSKTSFFNLTIAKKGIKRTLPVWLTHFIIWVFAMPILMNNIARHFSDINEAGYYVLMTVYVGGTLMAFFFSSVMTELLWNYLYSPKSIGFYHAIPVKRSTIFTTNLLVGLGALLLPAALCGGMAWIVLQTSGISGSMSYILNWFWIYTQMCVFFTGFSLLCAHMTGHTAGGPVIYVILNFAAIALEGTVRYVMSIFLYGIDTIAEPVTKALSPIFNIYYSCGIVQDAALEPYYFQGSGYLLALLAAGAVMTALGYLLYRARRSESAGEIVSERSLRPVFKYCMTAGFAFIIGMIFYVMSYEVRGDRMPSMAWFTVCMITGGAIGYFGSEMMLKKSLRVFKTSFKGFIAAALAIVLFGCSIGFDLFGVVGNVPSLEAVESVNIYYSESSFTAQVNSGDDCLKSVIDLHQSIIDNKQQDTSLYYQRYAEDYDYDRLYYSFNYISLKYTLKNGSTLVRSYTVPTKKIENGTAEYISGYQEKLQTIFSDQEVIKRAYPMLWEDAGKYRLGDVYIQDSDYEKDPFTLSSAAYDALIEAVKADLLSGALSPRDEYHFTYGQTDSSSSQPNYDLELSFFIVGSDESFDYGRNYAYRNFMVTPRATNTYRIISNPANYQSITEGSFDTVAMPA